MFTGSFLYAHCLCVQNLQPRNQSQKRRREKRRILKYHPLALKFLSRNGENETSALGDSSKNNESRKREIVVGRKS